MLERDQADRHQELPRPARADGGQYRRPQARSRPDGADCTDSARATCSMSAWAATRCASLGRRGDAGEVLPAQRAGAPDLSDRMLIQHRQRQAARSRCSQKTSNKRTIFQFIHPDARAKTCQLVVGLTQLRARLGLEHHAVPCPRPAHGGLSLFRPAETARVFHMMGEPDETRHLVVANERGRDLAGLVDPFGRRHRELYLHLGDGRRQCRLYRHRSRRAWTTCGDRSFRLQPRRAHGDGHRRQYRHRPGHLPSPSRGRAAQVLGVGRSAMDETAGTGGEGMARSTPIQCDLGPTSTAPAACCETAWETHGPIDGLVNNAGIIRRADSTDLSEEDWDEVMDVNLKTTFFLCQAFGAEDLCRPGGTGKIVNIASLLSFQGGIRVASYTAVKHGVAGITQTARQRVGGEGHQCQRDRAGLYRDQQHRGAARRSRPHRRRSWAAFRPAAGASRPTSATRRCSCCRRASDYMHGADRPGGRRLAGEVRDD